ncbi:hypothetical protein FM107_19460 [Sphingobacterium sp. JB170]|nr:hypothetical protein FM107_19460 [Sphingobacterium sp. JB170]
MQILGVSTFDKTPLTQLIAQNQNIKEQNLWNLFDAKT